MKNNLKDALNDRLSGMKMDEVLKQRVLNQIREKEEPVMKRKISISTVIAIAIIIIAAATFALTDGFGLFDLMGKGKKEDYAVVQKEAYDLVQKNLASAHFAHVDVTVTEAVFDGKYLRVVHSTKERDAAAPFDDEKIYNGEFSFDAAQKDGVWWNSLDWAIVNGQLVNPLGEAGVSAGSQNGETLAWIQYNLSEIETGDELTVELPIRGKQSIDNKELSFTMSVKDLPGVKYIKPLPEANFNDYTMVLKEMILSPIRVYAKAEITVDVGVSAKRCDEIMWKWTSDGVLTNEAGDNALQSTGNSSYYLENTEYSGENFETQIIDKEKPVRMLIDFEFMTRENYPDTFVLTNGTDSLRIPNT